MIQIKNNKLDEIAKNHFEKLKKKIVLDNDILKEIILAKPDKLLDIACKYNKYENKFKNKYKNFTTTRNKYNAYILAKKLDINTCPYCNINSTYTVSTKDNKNITRPKFDHFYPKSQYPVLALSFYNLIPCCSTCNHIKSNKKNKILHPYQDCFNQKAKFYLKIKGSKFYYDKHSLGIKLKPNNKHDKATKNTIETFRLHDLYQNHKDIALELIQKRVIYPDSYIDELAHNYSGLFGSRADLLRLITCGYIEDKDLGKRPLSKLIKDIAQEIKLI